MTASSLLGVFHERKLISKLLVIMLFGLLYNIVLHAHEILIEVYGRDSQACLFQC